MLDINLDNWKYLRKVSGLDTETVEYYEDLARRNEVLMIQIYNQDAFNIYIPEPTARQQITKKYGRADNEGA